MIKVESSIFVEIKETIEKMFSIKINDYVKINKRLLNFKWKVITNKGSFFIKQYNDERFPPSKEEQIKTGLSIQKSLSEKGIRCPHILSFNGDEMLRTTKNIRFVLTELCDGNLIKAGKINCNQFYDLGIELGKIHSFLNNQIDEKAIPTWIIPTKEQLLDKWNQKWMLTDSRNTVDINTYIKLQKEIFENIDLNIFKASKPGWAHSDLWCDNILFHTNSLSAIVDFDRFQYIYPELDISRAILSFALDDNCLRLDAVRAFIDGYNQFGPITVADVIRALKLLYCLESFWWLNSNRYDSEPPKRFAYEMAWLSINWSKLEKILGQ